MKKLTPILFLLIICFTCCSKEDEKIILNDNFRINLNHYIDNYPIKLPAKSKKIAYPSYHIYFEKEDIDTVFAIKLMPHLSLFDLPKYQKTTDTSMVFSEIKPEGYFLFKSKIPVFIFDKENYSKKVINKEMLIKKILIV